jgi:dienelactone hydrolase
VQKLTIVALTLACTDPAGRSDAGPLDTASSVPKMASAAEPSAMSPTITSSPPPREPPPEEPLAAKGRALVTLLQEGKFADVTAGFDATMAAALPAEKLAQVWSGLVAGVGAFQSIERARVEPVGAYRTALVTCQFANARLDAKIAFDRDEKVAGLFFSPAADPYADPPYVDRSKLEEREVTVGAWALPGTLTLPKGSGPFRAVVLVHGSGPNDRDESVGANKPFKDLAGGLASRGVAVLRYEKRTFRGSEKRGGRTEPPREEVHGAKLAKEVELTVDHETVDDALAAVALLRGMKEIDAAHVVVAGHSLGGQLAPRIAARAPGSVAAIAILAGSTRPIPDMMVEQVRYIASLDGRRAPEEDQQLAQLEKAAARARELMKGQPGKDGEVVLGAGAAYWADLGKYDALAVAAKLDVPIFVAQGGRDYQVTTVDFDAWKKALAGKPKVTFELLAEANHLFGPGEGKSAPEEYQRRAPVDVRLVERLAAWVAGL